MTQREELLQATAHNYGCSFRDDAFKYADAFQTMPREDAAFALIRLGECAFKDGWRSADANARMSVYQINQLKS